MVKIKQEKARQQEEDSETEKMFQSLFLNHRKFRPMIKKRSAGMRSSRR